MIWEVSNVQRAIGTDIYINGSRRKVLVASIMEIQVIMCVSKRSEVYRYV